MFSSIAREVLCEELIAFVRELKMDNVIGEHFSYSQGFDDCRDAILKELEELKEAAKYE